MHCDKHALCTYYQLNMDDDGEYICMYVEKTMRVHNFDFSHLIIVHIHYTLQLTELHMCVGSERVKLTQNEYYIGQLQTMFFLAQRICGVVFI